MRLYSGMSREFIQDTVHNRIATKLSDAYFSYFRYRPPASEVASWRNSLRAMAQIVDLARLHDHGILLEYQLPVSSLRLDCMICGTDSERKSQAVIVELKQWEACKLNDVDNVVLTWVGGREREVLHPSAQVGQYQQYLADGHTTFHEGDSPVRLSACSYLHNYDPKPGDPLLDSKFAPVLSEYPVFGANRTVELTQYLQERLVKGKGAGVLERVEKGKLRASRKLMEHVATTISNRAPWIMLDEQMVAFEKVLSLVRGGLSKKNKHVVIIRGGPGTGKSVIAINLLGELSRRGIGAQYATGSKAFTETLRSLLGSRSRSMLQYFNGYRNVDGDAIDVLICDEAHRIRLTSDGQYVRKEDRTNVPQIQEIIRASKVSVFLVDDRQVVRPNEIGSSSYIRTQAMEAGARVSEYELEVQFRCAGSDAFINWINNTLGVERTANPIWDGAEGFDFRIMPSVWELEAEIRRRADQNFSSRLSAGFCWKWSPPREDGTLVDDVVVGDFRRPWDAKPGKWKLAPGIPSAALWATDPRGIDQIGCVYNIQGFELDYAGVIWGLDLRYDLDRQEWVGDKKSSADSVVKRSKERFVDLVKNTYRVLLSRGMKGCYIYFQDKDTERFVRSRMEATLPAERLRVADRPE